MNAVGEVREAWSVMVKADQAMFRARRRHDERPTKRNRGLLMQAGTASHQAHEWWEQALTDVEWGARGAA